MIQKSIKNQKSKKALLILLTQMKTLNLEQLLIYLKKLDVDGFNFKNCWEQGYNNGENIEGKY